MQASEMPSLSMEVKQLIVDGVYSLVRNSNNAVSYFLVTGGRTKGYVIDVSGNVTGVLQPEQAATAIAGEQVTFSMDDMNCLKINMH